MTKRKAIPAESTSAAKRRAPAETTERTKGCERRAPAKQTEGTHADERHAQANAQESAISAERGSASPPPVVAPDHVTANLTPGAKAISSERTTPPERPPTRPTRGAKATSIESTIIRERPPDAFDAVQRLRRDLAKAAATLTAQEARFLVDYYYIVQDGRIRAGHQQRTLAEAGEPHELIAWVLAQGQVIEAGVKRALGIYSQAHAVGRWAESITGIGRVISAGLLAHIDITKAPTVGHIWRFAGLDPTLRWEKRTKRPWNAALKVLCWKIGESFVKVSNLETDFYGGLMREYKERIAAKNAAGEYTAAAEAGKARVRKATEAYKWYAQGLLPPGHIHARAKRWAVKLFLAHWHQVAYFDHFHAPAPKPYILTQPEHTHEIRVPNWPWGDEPLGE